MKHLLILILALPCAAFSQPPEAGSVSEPVAFATFLGDTPTDSTLAAHENKILVLMYYTPW